MFFFLPKHSSARESGFTLVELLVSISIFVIVTTVVLINQGSFNNSIFLNNVAYDTALALREAQSFGINVKVSAGSDSQLGESGITVPYGVSVNTLTGKNTVVTLFSDLGSPANGRYDAPTSGCSGECFKQYVIKRGVYVSDVCATTATGEACGLGQSDIWFVRPDPDAHIYIPGVGSVISKVRIILKSPQGNTRSVSTYSSGQIAVE